MKKLQQILGAILCLAALLSVTAPYTSAANPALFSDVPTTHWASTYIERCVSKGIVSGMGGGKFEPDNNLTRAQFITMLVNAFYKDEEAVYYGANADKISAYYDNDPQWWGRYAYFFSDKALTSGWKGNIRSTAVMNNAIDRYDMAQLVKNILNDKGVAVSAQDKAAAQGKITDWKSVPDMYRDGVATAFSLSVLTGFEDGNFGGSSGLTRAQGCVVMTKLDDTLRNGPSTPIDPPVEPEPPQPPTSTGEIEVTENGNSMGVAYAVADNGFPTGYLNNGEPISEDNVLELLAKAEKIWPTGTSWRERTKSDNHWYETSGSIVDNFLHSYTPGVSSNYACGGFAAMISDYLFGKNNNPAHRVTDPMGIRPGDIIVKLRDGKPVHVSLVVTGSIKEGDYYGRVITADGNYSDVGIDWKSTPLSEYVEHYLDPAITWEVWSRYPD